MANSSSTIASVHALDRLETEHVDAKLTKIDEPNASSTIASVHALDRIETEWVDSKFKKPDPKDEYENVNAIPFITIRDSNSVVIAPPFCASLVYPSSKSQNKKSICGEKDKGSKLYNAISRINEEVMVEYIYSDESNPFFHFKPWLCGNIETADCKTSTINCNIKESPYWYNKGITLNHSNLTEDGCIVDKTKTLPSNEYLRTVSYLSAFYKKRIPFNPKNIDYYLQCLGYLEYDETAFDIVCVRKSTRNDFSTDILYRDWEKLDETKRDKYEISNMIFIYPKYRDVVLSDIPQQQGKYTIGGRVASVAIQRYVEVI